MKELALKYGCNPNQKPSRIYMTEGELPIEVLNGRPGYINFLDALNGWQLVKELKEVTGMPAATSFKHVSPAGAAIGLPLSDTLKKIYFVDDVQIPLSPVACAYARARGADRMSSYGDFIALSDTCDAATATLIKREVSDGVIAPDYTEEALQILREKRKGTYNVIKIAPDYVPEPIERKQVFGITFEQGRNEIKLNDPALFENIPTASKTFTDEAKRDLMIALITLKYTQSNSVCYTYNGQTIGVIGGTGSGKSSLVNLICRLYDVDEGSVCVGGVDVRKYDMETLRNQVSVVLQKNTLFSGTILENLGTLGLATGALILLAMSAGALLSRPAWWRTASSTSSSICLPPSAKCSEILMQRFPQ